MIYIPIAEQELELDKVKESIDSLKKFGYEYTFVSSPEYAKRGEDNHLRNALVNHNKILDLAFKNEEKYICIQESRVVHLVDDNIEIMEKYLDDNPKCGAVYINRSIKKIVGHAWNRYMSLCLIRSEAVKDFKFKLDNPECPCDCQQLPKYLKEQGYTTDWLEEEPGRILKLPRNK